MTTVRTTPVATTSSTARVVDLGDRGPEVVRLQRALTDVGQHPGPVDGEFGPKTKSAVEKFQASAHLPVTGRADARTFQALTAKQAELRKGIFTAPARAEAKKLLTVQKQVDSFTSDGRVTAAEKQKLLASIRAAKAGAAPLVAPQADIAFETLQKVELMTKRGTLTSKSEAALSSLREGRSALVHRATSAAEHDPFAGKKNWASPFHGVRTRDFTFAGLNVHAVAIDLADPRVRLQTNSEASRGQSVSSFAQGAKAEVAINGDFFSFGSFRPSGLAMTDGKKWDGTSSGFEGHLAFNGHHAELVMPNHKSPEWATNAVSSRPTVLSNGKLVLSDPAKNERSARTGMGLSKSGRVAYLVAVEGKSGVSGLTATGLGKLLKSLGADDAQALDGGGSAQLYVKGRGMVQKSTDPGGARAVANVLMVQAG
jgi:exopolysaccharide biosynthesis protein